MKTGTKSILFGIHCLPLHAYYVYKAFLQIHNRRPTLQETIAIALHDIGYWGKDGIDTDEGKLHPYAGARVMWRLFGKEGHDLALGHSNTTATENGIPHSTLYKPDKYSWALMPAWLHWFLAKSSGEWQEFERNKAHGIGFNPWKFREMVAKEYGKTPAGKDPLTKDLRKNTIRSD